MCVSDRLRELREDCPPLQPYTPVRLWNRSLSPNLRLRRGGTQDGGEEKKKNLLIVLCGRVNTSRFRFQKTADSPLYREPWGDLGDFYPFRAVRTLNDAHEVPALSPAAAFLVRTTCSGLTHPWWKMAKERAHMILDTTQRRC